MCIGRRIYGKNAKEIFRAIKSHGLRGINVLRKILWRNVTNMNSLAENINPGGGCITRFGVIAADCPEAVSASFDFGDMCQSPLARSLESGHYVWAGQRARIGGKTAYLMFVFNIPIQAIAYYRSKFRLSAFIYGELCDGNIHSEYWEKVDATKPLRTKINPYQKKEWGDVIITSVGSEDQTVMGECFEYAVPFSLFPAISDSILRNISTLDEHSRAGAMNIALYGVGENAWCYRGLAYRGIKPVN